MSSSCSFRIHPCRLEGLASIGRQAEQLAPLAPGPGRPGWPGLQIIRDMSKTMISNMISIGNIQKHQKKQVQTCPKHLCQKKYEKWKISPPVDLGWKQ